MVKRHIFCDLCKREIKENEESKTARLPILTKCKYSQTVILWDTQDLCNECSIELATLIDKNDWRKSHE